ncbi:MAG: hypothetical protein HFI65_03170, partial [Lachnospiraceae bacterium]|nr:hypothetical protein [Lachnospiraceae bacterium]
MRDIVFEWFVPHVPSRKQMLVKAVITSAVIVFFADAFFFAAIMLIPTIVLAVVGFFLFRSWKIEYEYEYDLTVFPSGILFPRSNEPSSHACM